jgi:general transcriptional corepressor CYC8
LLTFIQGNVYELAGDFVNAFDSYQQALRHNNWSIPVLSAISCTLRTQEKYPEAMDYLRKILQVEPANGEVWGNLGHCQLMMDNLQDAYGAYQQALYYLPDPKEPKLWYGIGILYDRYGSLEHAEEAFSQVMRMQPDFEKANEIYFRLGIIYKQQQKFSQSLEVSLGHVPNMITLANVRKVFQIHCPRSSATIERRRYLVPDWSCARTTERCE